MNSDMRQLILYPAIEVAILYVALLIFVYVIPGVV